MGSSRSNVSSRGTWLADRWAQAGRPFVLGHALDMQASPGGNATHDTSDAQNSALLVRGGMRPQAYIDPAAMRATRERLRRRMPCMRQRAAVLTHVQSPTSQYHLPEIGTTIAHNAKRGGVAERFPEPAVQQSIVVARALLGPYDDLLRNLEGAIRRTATPHHAPTRDRLRPVPGIGERLRVVLLYEIQAIGRLPRGQDGVSYGRLVTCPRASAGKRYGTSGAKLGNADRPWAFSDAAVLARRAHPAGPQYRVRVEQTQGQGKALTVLAPTVARAVSDRLKREVACATQNFVPSSGRGAGEPGAALEA